MSVGMLIVHLPGQAIYNSDIVMNGLLRSVQDYMNVVFNNLTLHFYYQSPLISFL